MGHFEKALLKILRGTSDANVAFEDLVLVLSNLGFEVRIRGSHHIFTRRGVEEIINLQAGTGGQAKPYQVKQVRGVILRYKLGGDSDAE